MVDDQGNCDPSLISLEEDSSNVTTTIEELPTKNALLPAGETGAELVIKSTEAGRSDNEKQPGESLNERHERIILENTEWLNNITGGKYEEILEERRNAARVILQERTNQKRTVLVDKKEEEATSSDAGAFVSINEINNRNDGVDVVVAVYLRPNNTEHQVRHEENHVLSWSTKSERINENTFALKNGFIRDYYEVGTEQRNLHNDGQWLNEGITEYLTYLEEGRENIYFGNGPTYIEQMMVASFLIGGEQEDNDVIKAYLSDTVNDIGRIVYTFNEGETTKYEDFPSLGSKVSDDNLTELLTACMEFRIRIASSEDIRKKEINFFEQQIENMRVWKDSFYAFDDINKIVDVLTEKLAIIR